jgi:hypothetical protein
MAHEAVYHQPGQYYPRQSVASRTCMLRWWRSRVTRSFSSRCSTRARRSVTIASLPSASRTLIDEYGVPEFLSTSATACCSRCTSRLAITISIPLPFLSSRSGLRTDTSRVILDAARPCALTKHLAERNHEDIGQNVNLLGEVVLGNEEADRRYPRTLSKLSNSPTSTISP